MMVNIMELSRVPPPPISLQEDIPKLHHLLIGAIMVTML